jgi:DNA-directed RNA polymerase specialized sigma24 family protein
MNVTWLPPVNPERRAPRFDRHQFYDRGHFLNEESALTFSDMQRMSLGRVADLRKGRRLAVPEWALRNDLLQSVIVKCLENRFMLRPGQGTLKERLDRARESAKRHATTKRQHLDAHLSQFRACAEQRYTALSDRNYEQLFCEALAGKGAGARLHALEQHVRNADGDLHVTERAPELLAAVFYLYYRLGLDSPTIAEQLGLSSAAQVRQILFRASRVVRKEEHAVTRKPRARDRHLNREKAREIRRLSDGGMSWEEIAKKFGVVRETVVRVVHGKIWSDNRRPRG